MTTSHAIASPAIAKPKRIIWVDYARAFAILTVVLCHAAETVYKFNLAGIGEASLHSQVSGFVLFTVGRLGVPLFLFMSGYLMLDRYYSPDDCKKFWRTKWVPLLIATEVWIVIYNLFLCFFQNQSFDAVLLLKNMLFLERVGMGHMWYMPMIIGLYLFLPYIANGLRTLESSVSLAFPLGVSAAILLGVPVASTIIQCLGGDPLACEIAPGFSGGVYGCYMLFGYCVRKGAFKHIPTSAVVFSGAISFTATVGLQIYAYSCGVVHNVWYTSGLLLLTGLAIYEMLSRANRLRENKIVSLLSYYSFAIYLTHFPIKMALAPYFLNWTPILQLPNSIQVVSFAILVLIASVTLCALIRRIPKVGTRILYLR